VRTLSFHPSGPMSALALSLVGTRPLDVHRLFAWLSLAAADLRSLLRLVAHHTGLPIVIVGALAAVVSWRALKRGIRFVFEVMVAAAVLFAATRLGWIRW
jgi:hypothetical protein